MVTEELGSGVVSLRNLLCYSKVLLYETHLIFQNSTFIICKIGVTIIANTY